MKTIKLSNKNYVLKTQQKDNGSNYGLSICVHKKGEKMPTAGTLVKNDTPQKNLVEWAEIRVLQYESAQNI